MLGESIKELGSLLLAANDSVAPLTKTNEALNVGLTEAERCNKKLRRDARQDGDSLRSQINVLQSRRGGITGGRHARPQTRRTSSISASSIRPSVRTSRFWKNLPKGKNSQL